MFYHDFLTCLPCLKHTHPHTSLIHSPLLSSNSTFSSSLPPFHSLRRRRSPSFFLLLFFFLSLSGSILFFSLLLSSFSSFTLPFYHSPTFYPCASHSHTISRLLCFTSFPLFQPVQSHVCNEETCRHISIGNQVPKCWSCREGL